MSQSSTSTSITKSASQATIGVFDTIGAITSQVTNSIGTVGRALDSLDLFVEDMYERQLANAAEDMETFYAELHINSARRKANLEVEVKNLCDQNTDFAVSFQSHYQVSITRVNELKIKLASKRRVRI